MAPGMLAGLDDDANAGYQRALGSGRGWVRVLGRLRPLLALNDDHYAPLRDAARRGAPR
jgi:hypothetical protein